MKKYSYNYYFELFSKYSLGKLVNNYEMIEHLIVDDLKNTIQYRLIRNRCVDENEIFRYKTNYYRLIIDFIKNGRHLFITIKNINLETKSKATDIEINQIGLIKTVTLNIPEELAINSR